MQLYERKTDELPRRQKNILYQMVRIEAQGIARRSLERLLQLYQRYPSESLHQAIMSFHSSEANWQPRP